MAFYEAFRALARNLGESLQDLSRFIRCYVPRVERSGTRMQCGRAPQRSEERRSCEPANYFVSSRIILSLNPPRFSAFFFLSRSNFSFLKFLKSHIVLITSRMSASSSSFSSLRNSSTSSWSFSFSFCQYSSSLAVKFYLIVNNSLGCLMNNFGSLINHSIVIWKGVL
jgi:hypothetical protein